EFYDPGAACRELHAVAVIAPQAQGEQKSCDAGQKRDPARSGFAAACRHTGQNTCYERNKNQPDKDHRNKAMATKTTEPITMLAAYQRTRPVSVSRSPAHNNFAR